MRVKTNMFGEIESQHLPPVEQSLLLKVANDGRVRAIEVWDTPVDEDRGGIPNPQKYIEILARSLDVNYIPPGRRNRHHLVYPKAYYAQFGYNSIQYRFRESTSLMVDVQEQIHQYGHWVLNPIVPPKFEVMHQYVDEEDQVKSLFALGRAVIRAERWEDDMRLEGAQLWRSAITYNENYEPTETMFYDALDAAKDGQLGLMPDRQALADMGVPAATRYLGVLAGARALSLHRKTLETIKSTPI